jgi:UDP-glucose 4-epimerase
LATVTITGVAGFLGSHLADKFLAEGYKVIGIDSLIGGYKSNVPEAVEFHNIDLVHDFDILPDLIKGSELVIHAACTAYEGLSVFSPSLVVSNTSQATVNLLSASVQIGVKKFVYLSSMARYGDHNGKLFTEDMVTKPQDPYGIAKAASEQLVQNICDTHGIDWVVLVPHNIIGPRQKFDDPFRNVASIMVNRMLQGKQPIIYGDGSQQRCFSFVDDVVDPLFKACNLPEAIGEIVNIGPDEEPVTIKQLAEELADILGFDLDPIFMPGRPQEVPIALCSSDKARELLGYQTSKTLRAGLEDLVSWIREQGARPFDYHLPIEIHSDKLPRTWSQKLM